MWWPKTAANLIWWLVRLVLQWDVLMGHGDRDASKPAAVVCSSASEAEEPHSCDHHLIRYGNRCQADAEVLVPLLTEGLLRPEGAAGALFDAKEVHLCQGHAESVIRRDGDPFDDKGSVVPNWPAFDTRTVARDGQG